MKLFRSGIIAACLFTLSVGSIYADSIKSVQQRMLFRNQINDDSACQVSVSNGTASISGQLGGNAAAACPDAFAWIQFTKAIQDKFWDWAIDETMWPGSPQKNGTVSNPPLPLCTDMVKANCCTNAKPDPASSPNLQCPYFRADFDPVPPLPSITSQTIALVDHKGLVEVDPGRFLRDNELEVVFRNRSFFDYVYNNDLYSREGLASRNIAQNNALNKSDIAQAQRLRVRFPVDAVMVKVDFIRDDFMVDLGLIADTNKGKEPKFSNNADYPYVVLQNGTRKDEDGNTVNNYFYLVAMTNASKDLPNWHWYAIEHVANLGRCDYIGCNDSFGFTVDGTQSGSTFGTHFTPPMVATAPNTKGLQVTDALFVTGESYLPATTGEKVTDALTELFKGTAVGQGDTPTDLMTLHGSDPAWINYRLKGIQTDFTDPDGIPRGTGATVTEGGFVNSASCMTCHSQASINDKGSPVYQAIGGTWRANVLGFGQVEMGSPDSDWFYDFGGPTFRATQVDFVWGILGANCQSGPAGGPCDSYPSMPSHQ